MSYVYGITPDTLSSDYDYPTVIALAKAANRFLSRFDTLGRTEHLLQSLPVRPSQLLSAQSPDTAGFRQAFGTHYKSKLD